MPWTMTYENYQTPDNLAFLKFQTTDSTSGTSNLQTPNNFAFFKLQTPKKHISSPPFQMSMSPPRVLKVSCPSEYLQGMSGECAIWELLKISGQCMLFITNQNIVSVISHCSSHALTENSARYDVTLYVTMF